MSLSVPPDSLLRLLCGVTTVDDFAAHHGLSREEVEALRADGLARFAAAMAPPRRSVGRRLSTLLLGAVLVVLPATALAQLVTFTPNTAAMASEVNGNFQQLKTWLEQKVGAVGSANISTSGTLNAGAITGASLATAGALSATGSTTLNNVTISGTQTVTGTATFGTSSTANLNGAVAFGRTPQTGSSSMVDGTNVFQVNGVQLRVKHGNNGTASCDAFCLTPTFAGWAGACLGARLPNGQFTADCSYTTSAGAEMACLCATFSPSSP